MTAGFYVERGERRCVFSVLDLVRGRVVWQYEFEKNQYNIFILEGHPVYEEVFLSGSFVGEIVLWNIEMKVPIRKFQE